MIQKRDMELLLSRIPKDIQVLLMDNPGELFLAGGAIRSILSGDPIQDFDLFGPDAGWLQMIAGQFAKKRKMKLLTSENALTLVNDHERFTPDYTPVQFITKWSFADAQALLNEFDFTVAKAVLYFRTTGLTSTENGLMPRSGQWEFLAHPSFFSDLAAKRLVYEGGGTPGGSILRMLKLVKRGFNIQVESLAKLLVNVEMAAGSTISRDPSNGEATYLSLLREVDPKPTLLGMEK